MPDDPQPKDGRAAFVLKPITSQQKGERLQLVRDYLLAIAQSEMGSDLQAKGGASDLVQETLLEASRDFDQFAGGTLDMFRRWLRGILLNNLANFRRRYRGTTKRCVKNELPLDCTPEGGISVSSPPTPSRMAMRGEMFAALNSARASLPRIYQEVIELRSIQRLSFEEIASRISKSPEAARKLWCRAMATLQTKFNASKHDLSGLQ